jgi:hypothetical protein
MNLADDLISEIARLTNVHKNMLARCTQPNNHAYMSYGGRGIYVCDEWLSLPNFVRWGLANGSAVDLHLDRIDNDGPYSPDNCRFVSFKANMNNRRTSRYEEAFGERKTVAEWAQDPRCEVAYATLHQRLYQQGWDLEKSLKAVTHVTLTAWGETKTLKEWVADSRCTTPERTLRNRIKSGESPEIAMTRKRKGAL